MDQLSSNVYYSCLLNVYIKNDKLRHWIVLSKIIIHFPLRIYLYLKIIVYNQYNHRNNRKMYVDTN